MNRITRAHMAAIQSCAMMALHSERRATRGVGWFLFNLLNLDLLITTHFERRAATQHQKKVVEPDSEK